MSQKAVDLAINKAVEYVITTYTKETHYDIDGNVIKVDVSETNETQTTFHSKEDTTRYTLVQTTMPDQVVSVPDYDVYKQDTHKL